MNINPSWFNTYRLWITNKETKKRSIWTLSFLTDWDEVLEYLRRKGITNETHIIKIKKKYFNGEGKKGELTKMDKIHLEMFGRDRTKGD